ncbi:hypothetical protein EsDP_00001786 [Epichloe bromicola]|uniref:Uncharacterized protein n=1 Tax=Epichloe bromicola TaxID=79588 RepID=A0ABQ0CIU4_9HYPO
MVRVSATTIALAMTMVVAAANIPDNNASGVNPTTTSIPLTNSSKSPGPPQKTAKPDKGAPDVIAKKITEFRSSLTKEQLANMNEIEKLLKEVI